MTVLVCTLLCGCAAVITDRGTSPTSETKDGTTEQFTEGTESKHQETENNEVVEAETSETIPATEMTEAAVETETETTEAVVETETESTETTSPSKPNNIGGQREDETEIG